jgi:NSS family neurotransmitter:Na+ symporter
MQRGQGVVKNAFITGIGNNTVSILAGIMIFGTVFAILGEQMTQSEVLEVMRASGPASTGLTFIWMPQLFAQMPFGRILAILFFLGLTFAAFTSLVSMIELATRVLVDGGISRQRALALATAVGFLLGIPSATSLDFLGNQDFVWGIGLMISGAFIALAIIGYGVTRFRREAIDGIPGDWKAGRGWETLIHFIVPIEALILLVWWFYLSVTTYAPESWYDPTDPYSIATCVFQWGVVLFALVLANRWMVRHTLEHR